MADDYRKTELAQEEAGPLDGQLSIIIDDNIDPKLNQQSPDFDAAAYKKAIEDAGGVDEVTEQLRQSINETKKILIESERNYKKAIADALSNGLAKEFSLNVHGLIDYIQQHGEEIDRISETQEELAKLQPYIEMELDVSRTDNSPLSFVDFLDLVSVYGEPMNEWASGILEGARQRKDNKKSESPSIELAKAQGAIITLANKVATIANKEMGLWASIDNFKTIPEQLKPIYDEFGKLNEISIHGEQLQPLDNIHISFLMALLQIAYMFDLREVNSQSGAVIPIYLPKFFKETKIDPRPRVRENRNKLRRRAEDEKKSMPLLRRDKFIELMAPLDNRLGVIPGQGHYALARFISWDEKSEVANISIPYELKLVEMYRLENHGAISNIFHADIINEPNTAIEVANRIAIGVIQRGVLRSQEDTYSTPAKKPAKVTTINQDGTKTIVEYQKEEIAQQRPKEKYIEWAARFDTIINECPQLKRELERIRTEQRAGEKAAIEERKSTEQIAEARKQDHKTDPQRINKKLKDTFTAAIRIINEKSDMPQYYKSFKIKTNRFNEFKAPTSSTLKDKIIISHKGKNPDYDRA